MDLNGFNNWQEFFRKFGSDENEECSYTGIDPTGGAKDNKCRDKNLDMAGGFQDINPMLFTVISEIVGNILSGRLPANVADSFGNWLQLIAQVIALYNSQQSYFQSGPGRYYNPAYRNVTNPFCGGVEISGGRDDENTPMHDNNRKIKKKQSKSEIKDLKREIDELNRQIGKLKSEINQLKNKK